MNREILFRGKCFNTDEWVEGYLGIEVPDELVIQQFSFDEYFKSDCIDQYSVKPETIGQYTGLTDKNNVRIFEGDIIFAKHPGQKNAVPCLVGYGVYKDEDSFDDCRYLGFYLKAFGKCCSILTPLSDRIKYEVVGNIYDNPELMEATK